MKIFINEYEKMVFKNKRGIMAMIYAYMSTGRLKVASISPYLRRSLEVGNIMDPEFMQKCDIENCEWTGSGLTKGVTDPLNKISVFNFPSEKEIVRGLHAKLVQGLADVDPFPLCYDEIATEKGFGPFVRWVYFLDPAGLNDVFGIDFSIVSRPVSGIANSVLKAAEIVKVACMHGISKNISVALLSPYMCEPEAVAQMRMNAGLFYAEDWILRARELFGENGKFCPRCGLETMIPGCKFCYVCGCRPELIRKGGC